LDVGGGEGALADAEFGWGAGFGFEGGDGDDAFGGVVVSSELDADFFSDDDSPPGFDGFFLGIKFFLPVLVSGFGVLGIEVELSLVEVHGIVFVVRGC